MPLSRITQKQVLARVTLNATDGSATDAGDFIVLNTSADENDSLVLEEHTDFGTDILTSNNINPEKNIFRNNENTLKENHTVLNHINSLSYLFFYSFIFIKFDYYYKQFNVI